MNVDHENRVVVFDNLVSVSRELGSDEKITIAAPAEKAVACNAKGVFADKSLYTLNESGRTEGKKLLDILSA